MKYFVDNYLKSITVKATAMALEILYIKTIASIADDKLAAKQKKWQSQVSKMPMC